MNWAGCQSFNRPLLFLGKWRNDGHRVIALGKLQRLQADAVQGLLKWCETIDANVLLVIPRKLAKRVRAPAMPAFDEPVSRPIVEARDEHPPKR